MSRTSRLFRVTVLAALLATGVGLAAAQAAAPQEHHARMAERHQQRLDQLKTRLQLSPQQESAWLAYVARVTPDRHSSEPLAGDARADWAALTTPERIERMKAWQVQRQAAQQQRMDATLSFYGILSPAQRQVFDQATAPGFQRAGMRRHGPHRPEQAPGS